MKTKILINFARWRDADLDSQARTISGAMNDNPYFPKLAAEAAAVSEAAAAFSLALAKAFNGSGEDRSVKEDKRTVLVDALRVLGTMINLAANGNRTLLESTGFPFAREGAPGRRRPSGIVLDTGTGKVTVTFSRVGGAGVHLVEYTEAPVTADSRWTRRHTPYTVMEVSGLATGHKYAFRIAGILDDGEPVFSEPVVSKFVD